MHPTTASEFSDSARLRAALNGSWWLIVAQALMVGVGVVLLPYLTRVLGPTQYAQYATVMAILVWIDWSASALLNRAATKLVTSADDPKGVGVALIRLAMIIGLMAMLLLWSLASPLERAMEDPALGGWLCLIAIEIPLFVTAKCYQSVHSGLEYFTQRAIVAIGLWLTRLALVLILVGLGGGVTGALLSVILSTGVELILCWVVCPLPVWQRGGSTQLDRQWVWQELLPLFGSAMAIRATEGSDLVLLQVIAPQNAMIGEYAVALQVSMIPGLAGAALLPAFLSLVVRFRSQGRPEQIAQMGVHVGRAVLWLIPTTFAVAMAGSTWAVVMFGRDYKEAGPLIGIMLVAGLCRMALILATGLIAGAGRSSTACLTAWVGVPAAYFGYAILIPTWGATGAALSTTLGLAISLMIAWPVLSNRHGIRLPTSTLMRVGLVTAATVVLTVSTPATLYWQAMGFCLVLSVSAAIACRFGDVPRWRPL